MENKKLGILLMVIGIVLLIVFISYNQKFYQQGNDSDCFFSDECKIIERNLSFLHIGIGLFTFLFALGFYLLFFNKTEDKIMKRLEYEKERDVEKLKFDILLKALDPFEQKVVKLVKEQQGITQSTLRIKADISKAKLSYVLQELEKRNIVKREHKGKTLAIYLKI